MNTAYDPMDKLIADHIAEARDLRLRRRPAYAGVHEFSIGFENKMGRLLHTSGITFSSKRLLIAAIAILTLMMSMLAIQALKKEAIEYDFLVRDDFTVIDFTYRRLDDTPFRTIQIGYMPENFVEISNEMFSDYNQYIYYEATDSPSVYQTRSIGIDIIKLSHTYYGNSRPTKEPVIEETWINGYRAVIMIDNYKKLNKSIFLFIDNYVIEISGFHVDLDELIKIAENVTLK